MALNAVELAAQRRITTAFVAADAESIVLVRRTRTNDGAGGFIMAPAPLAAQTFRLIPRTDRTPIADNNDGQQEQPTFALLGAYDVDVEENDEFTFNGEDYLIRSVQRRTNGYETKVDVVFRG